MDVIKDMDNCIGCLYLEVPKHVADDVKEVWKNVKEEIERLKKALEEIAMGDIETRDEAIQIARQALLMQQALKEE